MGVFMLPLKLNFPLIILFSFLISNCSSTNETTVKKGSSIATASPDSKLETDAIDSVTKAEENNSQTTASTTETEITASNTSLGVYVNAVDGAISGMDINKIKLKIREFDGFESNPNGVLLGGPKIKIETVNQDTSENVGNNLFGDNLKTTIEVPTSEITAAGKNLAIAVRENIAGRENNPVKIIPPSSIVWQKIDDEKSLVSFPVAGSNVDIQLLKLESDVLSSSIVYVPRPAEPRGISCRGETSSKIKVSWGNPGGMVAAYKIVYSTNPSIVNEKLSCESGTAIDNIAGTANEYSVDSLSASTSYSFRLCSKNNAFPSPDVAPGVTCTTSTTAPNIPVYHLTFSMYLGGAAQGGLAYLSGSGDNWDSEKTMLVNGVPFLNSSLVLDYDGKPNISIYDFTNFFQFKKGNSWAAERNFNFKSQFNIVNDSLFVYNASVVNSSGVENYFMLNSYDENGAPIYELKKLNSNNTLSAIPSTGTKDYFLGYSFLKDKDGVTHWFTQENMVDLYVAMFFTTLKHHSLDAAQNYNSETFTNNDCEYYFPENSSSHSFRGIVDQNGKIHLAYICRNNGGHRAAYYSHNKSGSWSHQLIQLSDSFSEYLYEITSLASNRNGDVILIGLNNATYFGNKILKISASNTISLVADIGCNSESSSIDYCAATNAADIIEPSITTPGISAAIDYDGYFHIVYAYNKKLWHLHNRSGSWVGQEKTTLGVGVNEDVERFHEFYIEGMPTRSYRP